MCLRDYTFNPEVAIDEGEVTVELAELGVLGFGETIESAMEDLARELPGHYPGSTQGLTGSRQCRTVEALYLLGCRSGAGPPEGYRAPGVRALYRLVAH